MRAFVLIYCFLLAEDDGLMMPEVPTDEAVTDPIVASEEQFRDSEVDPESPPGMIFFSSSSFFLYRHLLTYIYIYIFCQLTCQRIPTTLSHPWTQLLMMLRMGSWRQKAFHQLLKKVLCNDNLDILIFDKIIFTPFSFFIGRL